MEIKFIQEKLLFSNPLLQQQWLVQNKYRIYPHHFEGISFSTFHSPLTKVAVDITLDFSPSKRQPRKLDIRNVVGLVKYAIKNGLIE